MVWMEQKQYFVIVIKKIEGVDADTYRHNMNIFPSFPHRVEHSFLASLPFHLYGSVFLLLEGIWRWKWNRRYFIVKAFYILCQKLSFLLHLALVYASLHFINLSSIPVINYSRNFLFIFPLSWLQTASSNTYTVRIKTKYRLNKQWRLRFDIFVFLLIVVWLLIVASLVELH